MAATRNLSPNTTAFEKEVAFLFFSTNITEQAAPVAAIDEPSKSAQPSWASRALERTREFGRRTRARFSELFLAEVPADLANQN